MKRRPCRIPRVMLVLVVLSLITGIGFRFYDLGGQVFWHDEVHTALRIFGFSTRELVSKTFDGRFHTAGELQNFQKPDSRKSLKDTLASLAGHPEHSPLYYLLARAVAPFFTPPLAGARFLAAMFGLLLLPGVFRLTRDLFPDLAAAPWIAVMLVSLSPFFILYAREARQYSLWTLVTVLCMVQFWALWHQQSRNWRGYGILIALGLYAHLMFFCTIVSHALIAYIDPVMKEHRRKFTQSVLAGMLLFTPWLWVVYRGFGQLKNYTDWMKNSKDLGILAANWALNVHHLLFDLPCCLGLALISIPVVIGGVAWVMWRSNRKAAVYLGMTIITCVLPVVIPDLVKGGQRSLMARYVMPAMLCLEICVAAMMARLMTGEKARAFVYALLILVFAGTAAFGYQYFKQGTWWTRFSSYYNPQIAERINKSKIPLIIANDVTVNPGDMLSLSYLVRPETLFLMVREGNLPDIPKDHELFVLSPNGQFRESLARRYPVRLDPVLDIPWWFSAKD